MCYTAIIKKKGVPSKHCTSLIASVERVLNVMNLWELTTERDFMNIFEMARCTWLHFLFNHQRFTASFATSFLEHMAHIMAVIYSLMHQIYFFDFNNHKIKVSLTQRQGYNSGVRASSIVLKRKGRVNTGLRVSVEINRVLLHIN